MSKVWSNRFDGSLNPFIEEFNASISFDKTLILEDIECSIAHAKMLGKTKVLSTDESLKIIEGLETCLLYTSPSPRDGLLSRMPSSA